jgi:MoaA/NifB/PqqE/SkfB family radical SAM enzyme
LTIPAAALARAGLDPDGDWVCALDDGRLVLVPDAPRKIYVEATTCCNLCCATCIRNAWHEPLGHMPLARYQKLLDGLPTRRGEPITLAFAGFGEPLVHPDLLEMVRWARAAGLRVELITNGLLLTPEKIGALLGLGVAQVAISVDGADDAGYAGVRGTELEPVLANLAALCAARRRARAAVRLGLAFVAMVRNIASLPDLLRLAGDLDLDFVSISNVLPHTPEMAKEALWGRTAWESNFVPAHWRPRLALGRMDVNDLTRPALEAVWRDAPVIPPPALDGGAWRNHCRFAHEGTLAVSWDGRVAPCLSLLHSHPEYVYGHWKQVQSCTFGNIDDSPLASIWRQPDYREFRRRMRAFDFPTCFVCGGCPSTEGNAEDCYGNEFPVCSECLWAQGIVLCP